MRGESIAERVAARARDRGCRVDLDVGDFGVAVTMTVEWPAPLTSDHGVRPTRESMSFRLADGQDAAIDYVLESLERALLVSIGRKIVRRLEDPSVVTGAREAATIRKAIKAAGFIGTVPIDYLEIVAESLESASRRGER